jgi:hypothetical protein
MVTGMRPNNRMHEFGKRGGEDIRPQLVLLLGPELLLAVVFFLILMFNG